MKIRKFSTIQKVERRNSNLVRNHRRQENLRRMARLIPSWRGVPVVPGRINRTVHSY